MKPLFRKKLFLEVYFPIAIVAGPFITLITGWSLIIGLGLGGDFRYFDSIHNIQEERIQHFALAMGVDTGQVANACVV